MRLINTYLPHYSFRETHSCKVQAAPATVIAAAARFRPEADPLYRALIRLREAPIRVVNAVSGRSAWPQPVFGLDNFLLLGHMPDRELAYGLIGRFWRPDFGLVPVADSAAFEAFASPGVARLAIGFSAVPMADGTTLLTTETRVFCPDRASRLKFAPYWALIRPVSDLIRRRLLGAIKTASEAQPGG